MAWVFQTANFGEAHIRIAVVEDYGQADLLVHRVSSKGLADGDALWYISRDQQEAAVWVYPTSIGMADVCVCFVDSYGEAGWIKPSKYKGRFRNW